MAAKQQLPSDIISQNSRVLAALREAPKDTVFLREELDILAPHSRVSDLRKRGHHIYTEFVKVANHVKVARYYLIEEAA